MGKTKELPSITGRTLTYVHKIPILKTKLFWEKLKEGEIYATKCKKCGKLYYPPQADCPKCLTSDMEWVKLSQKGLLETYTCVQVKPQGFTHYEPYIIAIARVPEGVRVMGWVENMKLEDLKVGLQLNIGTKTLPDGHLVITLGHKKSTVQNT